jgi:type I restriction enzyme S subunit
VIDGLKPYPEYKDSGSRWLAKVPLHWGVHNLRTLIRSRNERNRADLPLLSVAREKGVFVRSLTDASENHNVIPEDLSNYKVARTGNLVINKMKAWQGSMGIAPCDGIVSPAYYVYDLAIANRTFGQALLRSKPYVAHFGQASDGVRVGQWDLSISGMRQIPVLVPPPKEQAAIVRYLDHALLRLDKAIRAKRKIISLLREQKQAIIHRAVTRGLDSDVKLKDSGIPWLGQIPAHWEILRGKYLGRLFSTPSVLDSELTEVGDGNLMYLKVSDLAVADESFKLTRSRMYVKRSAARSENRRPLLVFPKRGGAIYTNRVAIIESTCLLDPNLMGWEINARFDPHYVALLLKTRTLADLADVSSVPQINNHHINPTRFPAPPVKEQRAIVVDLRMNLIGVHAAISRIEREIELLREYRTRLIADVVTGKLDVRAAAARLPDEASAAEPELAELEESGEELAEENI